MCRDSKLRGFVLGCRQIQVRQRPSLAKERKTAGVGHSTYFGTHYRRGALKTAGVSIGTPANSSRQRHPKREGTQNCGSLNSRTARNSLPLRHYVVDACRSTDVGPAGRRRREPHPKLRDLRPEVRDLSEELRERHSELRDFEFRTTIKTKRNTVRLYPSSGIAA